MSVKTKYNIKIKDYLTLTIYARIRKKISYIVGKIIHKLLSFEKIYITHTSRVAERNRQNISKEKLNAMLEPKGKFNLSLEKDYGGVINDKIIKNTNFYRSNTYHLCAKVLKDFIKNNKNEIKKVVQIGCGSFDTINDYLSSEFKDIDFISNDLMIDLEQMHIEKFPNYTKRKNWECVQGYQIELLNKNILNGDLFYSKSMLCAHSPAELNELFSIYEKKKIKYIFMLERWYPKIESFNFLKLDRPENIEINKPYISGYFHHNYVGILNKYGFDTLSSNIYVNHGSVKSRLTYNLFIFAKLR